MTEFSPSRACAEFASRLKFEEIPEKSVDMLKRDILDWAGCAIAGSSDRSSEPIRNVTKLLGGPAEASVFGAKEKTDLRMAATENAYFGHILEMDDVDRESISHPATVVMPPAFAVGEYLGKSGKEIITAIAGGFEVMLRIGAAVTPAHYQVWHTTATTGVFGAAMSSGKLLGLSEQQMLWSLGNAGTVASGLWQFNPDGAMSKFLHAGNAAGNGVLVSLLAKNGFSGASHILEGKQGFFAGLARQETDPAIFEDFGKRWRTSSFSFKPYPCCRHTHSAIDAALSIREQLAAMPGEKIARLTLHTYGTAMSIAGKTHPKTTREAKFSISYCVATTILGGTPSEVSFSSGKIADPALADLLGRITVIDDPKLDALVPHNWPCLIEVVTESGKELTARVKAPKGDPENEVSWEGCELKFRSLTTGILSENQIRAVVETAKHFEEIADFSKENLFLAAS